MRIGIFVGSFDPFTIGHAAIVRRALPLFDRLVIGVGVNESKQYMFDTETRVDRIAKLYAAESKIKVAAFQGLTIDFAIQEHANFIVKGVRSVKDFEYEREQAHANKMLSGVETILLYAEPEMECVSSSLVRELIHFGRSVDEFLPKI